MSKTQTVDFNQELSLLKQLIAELWQGTQDNNLEQFVADVFNAGLDKGRLWVSDAITHDLDTALEADKQFENAMKIRRNMKVNDVPFTSLYDGLCVFNMWLGTAIRDIYHAATHDFDFTSEVEALTAKYKREYDLSGLRPIKLPAEDQKRIVDAYQGVDSSEARVNSVADMLMPSQAFHSAEEHGRTFSNWFISAIFSHGIYCAKHTNTAKLLNTLLPVYRESVNAPVNFDNGPELLEQVKSNEFIAIALQLSQPEFQSTKTFNESKASYLQRQEMIAQETPEQKADREEKQREKMRQMTLEILEEDDTDEEEAYRTQLAEVTATLPAYAA